MSLFSNLFAPKAHIFNASAAGTDLKILLLLTVLQVDFAAARQMQALESRISRDKIEKAKNILLTFGLSLFANDGDPDLIMESIHNFASRSATRHIRYDNFEYQAAFAEMFYCACHGLPLDFDLPLKMDVLRILDGLDSSWPKILDAVNLCYRLRQETAATELVAYAVACRDAWSQLRGSDPENILKITAPAMSAYLCGHCPFSGLRRDGFKCSYGACLFLEQVLAHMHDPLVAFFGVARLLLPQGEAGASAWTSIYDGAFEQGKKDYQHGIFSAFPLSGVKEDAVAFAIEANSACNRK